MESIQIDWRGRARITQGESYLAKGNVIHFRNNGNCPVFIDDNWTLQPRDTLSIGGFQPILRLHQNFKIRFGDQVEDLLDPIRQSLELAEVFVIGQDDPKPC